MKTQMPSELLELGMANDNLRRELRAAFALLKEIRYERRAEPYSMDGTSQWVLWRQSDFTRIDALLVTAADQPSSNASVEGE